jgi:excisionase family DNA binding protein
MTVTELSLSGPPAEVSITPRLLTLKQAASYVGVSSRTLRYLVLNGTVPAVRMPSARISTGRNRAGKRATRVVIPSTDPRVRSLRKVLVDRFDLDRLIAVWKAA